MVKTMLLITFVFLSLSLNLINADQIESLQGCGGAIQADQGVLEFPLNGGPIAGQTCIWTIHLEKMRNFRYYFNWDFWIPGSDENCSTASLGVYSLSNIFSGSYQGLEICNEKNYNFNLGALQSHNYYEDGNTLAIILRTDEYTSGRNVSFKMYFYGQDVPSNPPVQTQTFTTSTSGIVQYPIGEKYPPNTVNTWIIQPDIRSLDGQLSVNNVDIEGCSFADPCLCDALIFYEVTSKGGLNVADKYCGERTTGELMMSGNKFIAVFYADYLNDPERGFGFQFTWRSGEVVTTIPTTTLPPSTTSPTTPRTTSTTPEPDLIIVTECGGIVESNIGKIIYKLDETYENSERCVWILRSPTHNKGLYVTKGQSGFEIGKDYLSIHGFDKSDSESTLLGKTTNEIENRYIRRGVAVVVFTSDASNQGQGFELEFKFNGTVDTSVNNYDDFFSSEVQGVYRLGGPEPGERYGNNSLSLFVMSRNNTFYTDIGWSSDLHIFKVDEALLCSYDGIRVYSVALDTLNYVGRYCSNSDKTLGPFLATNLYIYVLHSDYSKDDGGFEIMWNLK